MTAAKTILLVDDDQGKLREALAERLSCTRASASEHAGSAGKEASRRPRKSGPTW